MINALALAELGLVPFLYLMFKDVKKSLSTRSAVLSLSAQFAGVSAQATADGYMAEAGRRYRARQRALRETPAAVVAE